MRPVEPARGGARLGLLFRSGSGACPSGRGLRGAVRQGEGEREASRRFKRSRLAGYVHLGDVHLRVVHRLRLRFWGDAEYLGQLGQGRELVICFELTWTC